jgi:hypothetical protein
MRFSLLIFIFCLLNVTLFSQSNYYTIFHPKKGVLKDRDTLLAPIYDDLMIHWQTQTVYTKKGKEVRFFDLNANSWLKHPTIDSVIQIQSGHYTKGGEIYQYRSEQKWGLLVLKPHQLSILLEAQFDSIKRLDISGSEQLVYLNSTCGVFSLNNACYHVVPELYTTISRITHSDLIKRYGMSYETAVNNLRGICSERTEIMPAIYSRINFNEATIEGVKSNNKVDVLFFQPLKPVLFENIDLLLTNNNLYALKKDKWSIYDQKAIVIEPFKDLDSVYQFHPLEDGFMHLFDNLNKDYLFVFAQKADTLIVKELNNQSLQKFPQKKLYSVYPRGIALMEQERIGLVDFEFKPLIPFNYSSIVYYAKKGAKHYYFAHSNDTWDYFEDSTKMTSFKADTIYSFNLQNGLIILQENEKYGLKNLFNSVKSELKYDFIFQAYADQLNLGRIGNNYYRLINEKEAILSEIQYLSTGYTTIEDLQSAILKALTTSDSVALQEVAQNISPDWNTFEGFAMVKGDSRGIFYQFSNEKCQKECAFHLSELRKAATKIAANNDPEALKCLGFENSQLKKAFSNGDKTVYGIESNLIFQKGTTKYHLSLGEIYFVNGVYKCFGSFKMNQHSE